MNSNSQLTERFPLIKKEESELTAFTEKYPWCSIAQLSLLHLYKKNNSLQFDQQATKTALFFNNTNWLNWQLHLLSKEAEIEESRKAKPGIYEEQEQNETIVQNSHIYPATNTNEEIIRAETETSAEPVMHNENIEQPISYININEEIIPAETETSAEQDIQKENIEQPISYNNTNEEVMPAEPDTSAVPEMRNEVIEQHENIEQPISPTNTNEEIIPAETEMAANPEMQNTTQEQPAFNPSPAINHKEEIIAFEPLHTTDYFASQGIKLTDEPVSNDKLGSQLKSFTEWLKSMKKIHHENLPAGDEQTDKNIQQIAEHSNVDAEVVTEAMADVLVKQDKNEKAIEVYEKLSLIYPSKSAYFAAKIESLSTDRQI